MKLLAVLFFVLTLLPGGNALAQGMVGKPCLFNEYFPEWRCFPAILRDASGHLSCGGNRINIGGVTTAKLAAGPVCATSVRCLGGTGRQYHFAYRDQDGGIQDLYYLRQGEKDQWHAQRLNGGDQTPAPPAAGNPSGLCWDQAYHVVYRDPDGGIQDLSYTDHWEAETLNLGDATLAPPAAGDPVQQVLQDQRHVLYRDFEGGIQDLWFDHGWQSRQLNQGGQTDAPPAAGDPSALEDLQVSHVFYRDPDGLVQDLYDSGGWKVQQLNGCGATCAPLASGDPAAGLGAGGIRHVTYRDPDGNLQDLWYHGTWHCLQLNNGGSTEAPPAASDPFLMVPPSQWEYIGYVDIHGAGQMLVHLPRSGWAVTPLNAQTPPSGVRWDPPDQEE